jgi:opacity protein-like surface antigen
VPNSTFDNQADGSIGSIVTGYHWKSGKILSLDLQGRLSVNSNSWQMALPEPASFRYDLPLNLAVSLLPSFHLSEKFAVFAEAGLALGKIREQKTAATTSRYDVEKWRPGIVAGFGLHLALDERWSVHAGYRRTWYQDHEFATYLANGTQVETVISRVVQSTSTMVLVREF